MERLIALQGDRKPRLLLHSCCGPCSSSVLESITNFFDLSLLWYNPNLYPEAEFEKRLAAQRELLEKMGLQEKVKLLVLPWDSGAYYRAVQGLEQEPEGGARCTECFRLRLRKCAETAKALGFDGVMLESPKAEVEYLHGDFHLEGSFWLDLMLNMDGEYWKCENESVCKIFQNGLHGN